MCMLRKNLQFVSVMVERRCSGVWLVSEVETVFALVKAGGEPKSRHRDWRQDLIR